MKLLILVLIGSLSLSSCYNSRYLQEGELLYKDSNIELLDSTQVSDEAKLSSELRSLERHKANQRIIGIFEMKLWLHNEMGQREQGFLKTWLNNEHTLFGLKPALAKFLYPKDEPGFRQWIQSNFTEPPVLLDTNVIEETSTRMIGYLNNRGYFNPAVSYETGLDNKRATVSYQIDLNSHFTINTLVYQVEDSLIGSMIPQIGEGLPLQIGEGFELNAFKEERKRIQLIMQDSGYYAFDRSFVEFDLDSSATSKKLDVIVKVRNPSGADIHQRYFIGEVICETVFGNTFNNDTTPYKGISFVGNDGRFRPSLLHNAITIRPGEVYSASKHASTIRRLTELGAFKFVSINYKERKIADTILLDAVVRIIPLKKQGWSAELNANTKFKVSPLGSDVKFVYKNRNLFHNADLFTFDLSGGLGTQFGTNLLNNLEIAATVNLDIPKFLLPPAWQFAHKAKRPATSFQASYRYSQRLEYYTLHSTSLSTAYRWERNNKITHRLAPIDLSLVRLTEVTDTFKTILTNNPLLRQSFEEQLILGSTYTFLYNNAELNARRDRIYFRSQIGVSGNLFNSLGNLIGRQSSRGENLLFDIPVSQFLRIEEDVRYYLRPKTNHEVVFRSAAGIGFAYGNSEVLPYVRQFYTGGASAIRAWRIRRLGPGSSVPQDSTSSGFIDRTGDFNLEGNVEYRFPVYKLLRGAFFIDAGNIWLLNADESTPGGELSQDWVSEIAIGTGFGLRADFDFFVFRADLGIPVRDPAYEKSERWVITNWGNNEDAITNRLVFNIAIGYPF